jgi:hypothetical protein
MGVRIICRDHVTFRDKSLTRDELKMKIQASNDQFISVTENDEVYEVHIPQIIYFKEYDSSET